MRLFYENKPNFSTRDSQTLATIKVSKKSNEYIYMVKNLSTKE